MIRLSKKTYCTSVRGVRRYLCNKNFTGRRIKHEVYDFGIIQKLREEVENQLSMYVRVFELISCKNNKVIINQYDIIQYEYDPDFAIIIDELNKLIDKGKHFGEIFDYLRFKIL